LYDNKGLSADGLLAEKPMNLKNTPGFDYSAITRCQTPKILACNIVLVAWFGIIWGVILFFGPATDSVRA
jgi:hypothetical protein